PSRLRSPWCPASSASTLLPSTTLFRSLGLGDRGIGDIGGRVVDGITRAGGEVRVLGGQQGGAAGDDVPVAVVAELEGDRADVRGDRKSTRLNSSHVKISYAVFCLKKKS